MRHLAIRFFCGLSLLLIGSTTALSQKKDPPRWVLQKGKSLKYNDRDFLTGFGFAAIDKTTTVEEAAQLAKDMATQTLSQQIIVKFKSETNIHLMETEDAIFEDLQSTSQSISNVEISGLHFDQFADKKTYYFLAYIERPQIILQFQNKLDMANQEIYREYHMGLKYEKENQKEKALEKFTACQLVAGKRNEYKAILVGLGEKISQDEISSNTIADALNRNSPNSVRSAEDLAYAIAYSFKEQSNIPLKNVKVHHLTFEETGVSSPFSNFFTTLLDNKLASLAQWQMIDLRDYNPELRDQYQIDYAVRGSYWLQGDKVKFSLTTKDIQSGQLITVYEVQIDKEILLATAKDLKPVGYDERKRDYQRFQQNEIINSGLMLEVFTSKGEDNPVFEDGDRMKLSFRVNYPCYIRLIYHDAKGNKVLLLDNMYIDETKVNKVYTLPHTFQTSPPFGLETLQVNAQPEKFTGLQTRMYGPYKIITESIDEVLMKTRGMFLDDSGQTQQGSSFKAEKRINVITTPRVN
ncbi:DUF4384 domain-containing protein [Algivirga pacifica]|uniref:DUF4384 domain-containing protein n=1 Tax=Algivirga pacifica TaxID=1162670 RepID=A0ABP9D6G0_9BACT